MPPNEMAHPSGSSDRSENTAFVSRLKASNAFIISRTVGGISTLQGPTKIDHPSQGPNGECFATTSQLGWSSHN
jgi:hypothetical protein